MQIQNLINEIKKENKQQRKYRQDGYIAIGIETLKGLTIGEIQRLNKELKNGC